MYMFHLARSVGLGLQICLIGLLSLLAPLQADAESRSTLLLCLSYLASLCLSSQMVQCFGMLAVGISDKESDFMEDFLNDNRLGL